MSTPLVDRFHFLARAGQHEKTPILAQVPDVKSADGVATLRLYDPIDDYGGPWGVSAKEFVTALDALPDDTTEIRLLINSPGGIVWEGLAILNALRAHKAKVVAVVEGIAASAASFVAAGADELLMMPNSELFVHNAWGLCVGNAADMQKMADDLLHEDRNIASIYAAKAGGSVDEWLAEMAAETWYSPEEAVAAGLADAVVTADDGTAATKAKARFDLSIFSLGSRRKPAAGLACTCATASDERGLQHQDGCPQPFVAARPSPKPPSQPQAGPPTHEGGSAVAFSDEQITALRQRLGVADDADEATILAALDEALDEQHVPPPDSDPDPAVLAEVTRLSTELAELRAQAATREKDELFASWLRDGKTSPAEKTELEAMYDAAPTQTAALVNARAKGSIVPVNTIGHEAEGEETDDDRIFAQLFGPTTKVS